MRTAGRVAVGLGRLFGDRAGGALGILTYHRIAAEPPGAPKPLHNVAPGQFREQIAGLRAQGFRFWPLSKVLERPAAVPPRTLVLTFDDGYGTVHSRAWPVLRELQTPASVFLATAHLDDACPFPFDAWGRSNRHRVPAECYLPLSRAQCREMAASGWVELGSHTHSHGDFRGRPEAFSQDLERSLRVLREGFRVAGVPFAFPYGNPRLGYASEALRAAARRSGVTCALSTEPVLVDPGSDPFCWGRFNVFPWDTSRTLAAKLEGWYSWAPKAWQRLAGALAR
jgi:peptidoglycan/xylan/chitin deacetylase (PgdA/CDA1 family)